MQAIVLAALVSSAAISAPADPTYADGDNVIEVVIVGARSDAGTLRATIYDTKDGFPTEPKKAKRNLTTKLEGKRAVVRFTGLPPGTYAVAVLHDEDDDGAMKSNFIGIPQEGVGVSRDARGRFGPPPFDKSAFDHRGLTTKLVVQLDY